MKLKDYFRLSKISLKSRKKTTRSTVRGISFGLILLMPLLFIVIAFHIDLNKEVNKDASIRVFNIEMSNQYTQDSYSGAIHESYIDKIYDIDGVSTIIKYNQYTFENSYRIWDDESSTEISSPRFNVVLDGNTFALDKNLFIEGDGYNGSGKVGILVIDSESNDNIFLRSDNDAATNGNPLIAGSVFSENSNKEIMVSSNFLAHYNLDTTIIGKKITLNYQLSTNGEITTSKTSITGDFSAYNNIPVNIFKEFTIVGVYDSNIYKTSPRKSTAPSDSSNHIYDTYFWLTTDSVYTSTEKSYIPELISIEVNESDGMSYSRNVFYYPNDIITLSKNATMDQRLFIPCGMGVSTTSNGNSLVTSKLLVEFDSYGEANSAVSIIDDLLKKSSTSSEEINATSSYMPETFQNYRMFYTIFTYISIILAIFGGIIFFATLLNLYNTIHYSVQSRKNYLGLSRAIGMKNKEVTRLYFIEIFQIFKRSYIWTAIFGGGICGGICYLFKMIMSSEAAAIITIDLSLNPIFILVAFGALVIVNTIISIIFAYVACHNVANKPILDVLVENR